MRRGGYNRAFLERWFGGPVHDVPSNPTAGNGASAVLVQPHADRVGLTIVNMDTASVIICPADAGPASATRGIVLGANGGNVSMTVDSDGVLPALGWNSYCATKAAQLFVVEIVGGN